MITFVRAVLLVSLLLASVPAHAVLEPDPAFSGDGAAPDLGGPVAVDASDNAYVLAVEPTRIRKLLAADGAPDDTFGTLGTATFAQPSSAFRGLCVDSNTGSIFVVGGVQSASTYVVQVLKVTAAGEVDDTWGTNGAVTSAIPNTDDIAFANTCVVLADGRFLVAGDASVSNPDYDPSDPHQQRAFVARFDATGALDATYGAGGSRGVGLAGRPKDLIGFNQLALTPDGGVVAGGYAEVTDDPNLPFGFERNLLMIRLTGAGAVSGGAVLLDLGEPDDTMGAIRPQTDGSIVFTALNQLGAQPFFLGIGRLTAQGDLDTTYDDDYGPIPTSGNWGANPGASLDSLGRLLIGGGVTTDTGGFGAVFRLLGRPELSVAGADGINGTKTGGGGGGALGGPLLLVAALAALGRRRGLRGMR